MASKKTSKEFVEAVAQQTGLTIPVVRRVLLALADQIYLNLDASEVVVIPGLGEFKMKDRPARTKRSANGELVDVPAHRAVVFVARKGDWKERQQQRVAERKAQRRAGATST
jgi:nucleoid DNA-binding protein